MTGTVSCWVSAVESVFVLDVADVTVTSADVSAFVLADSVAVSAAVT